MKHSEEITKVEIRLTQGQTAMIDASDAVLICSHKWHALKRENTYYAATKINRKSVLMHRMILGTKDGELVDHANGNGLDNRRPNIRIATSCQNMSNRPKSKSNRSGFKGVRKITKGSYVRYMASLKHLGALYYGGIHFTPLDAAHAYDALARQFHGDFARTNFPATTGGPQ